MILYNILIPYFFFCKIIKHSLNNIISINITNLIASSFLNKYRYFTN